jgi:AmmeMemoRadiSam system protein A
MMVERWEESMSESLTSEEKTILLTLARSTLEAHFRATSLPAPAKLTRSLEELRGAFVTLTEEGVLRGCIGHVVGSQPLWRSVRENALSAALRDPRFPPVKEDELSSIDLEISALTPLTEVDDVEQIEVGRHGVMIESGVHRGLLLPQVATEYGWDLKTFLDHTCRKAGLKPGCWNRPETKIMVFSAEVFHE